MKNAFALVKSRTSKTIAGVTAAMLASNSVLAQSAAETAITAAQTEAESNVALIIGAVIAVGFLGMGIGYMLSLGKKV